MDFLKRVFRFLLWYAGIWLLMLIAVVAIGQYLPGPLQALLVLAWFIVPAIVARRKTKKKPSIEEMRSEMNASAAKSAEKRKQAPPPPQPQPQPKAAPKEDNAKEEWGSTPFGRMKREPLTKEQEEKIAAWKKKGASEEGDFNDIFDMFFGAGAVKQSQGQPAQTSATPPPRPQTPPPPPKAPEPQQAPPPPPKSPEPPKIDINQATLQDLESIPAVNQILARKILKIREQEGCFSSLQQLFDKAALPDMVQKELSRRCKVETAQGGQESRIIDF